MPEDVELFGAGETDAALRKLAELLADLRPFWPMVVPIFIGWMRKQFESEGSYFGEGWQPLSDQYAAWKMQHYPGHGILSAEGDLRRAATTPKREAFPQMLVLRIPPYEKTGRSGETTSSGRQSRARVGTGKQMDPAWFQEGTERMVARPLLAEILPEEGQAQLREAAEIYIRESALKLGLSPS